MAPRNGEPGSAPERRFFLARAPVDGRAELLADEEQHLRRVLRLSIGDRFIGLDGQGGAWPVVIRGSNRGGLDLAIDGQGRQDPAPGTPAASLPWIEVAAPWPRPGRLEEMLGRLTQHGAAAIVRLDCERAGPRGGPFTGARLERLGRVLREACKQSSRTWLPVLAEEGRVEPATSLLLDPGADLGLTEWVAGKRSSSVEPAWTREHPLRLLIGPEGGWSEGERAAWLARGAQPARLGPHVLRLETAAEAAMAILATGLFRRP